MFFQGPFLQFLRLNPKHGLDAILRLVNQATANWAELRKGEAQAAQRLTERLYSLIERSLVSRRNSAPTATVISATTIGYQSPA